MGPPPSLAGQMRQTGLVNDESANASLRLIGGNTHYEIGQATKRKFGHAPPGPRGESATCATGSKSSAFLAIFPRRPLLSARDALGRLRPNPRRPNLN